MASLSKNGNITQEGLARVKRALFALAYGNPKKIQRKCGKGVRQITDGNKIFRYNNRTHEIELADGRKLPAVQNSGKAKLSTVDSKVIFNDNEDAISKRIFDKYLGDDIMKMVRETIEKEIGEYVDLSKMSDPVARDKTRDKLPCIRQMLAWYNKKNTQNDPVLKNTLAIRIEYARRCFENDERIQHGIIRPIYGNDEQRRIRDARTSTLSRSNTRGVGKQLQGKNVGLLRNVSGGKSSARKQFLKIYDEEAKKHSERQGAFSVDSSKAKNADKPKYSYDDALIIFGGKAYPLNKKIASENGDGELIFDRSETLPTVTADGATESKATNVAARADNKGGVKPSAANVETNSPSETISQLDDNGNESFVQRVRNKISSLFDNSSPSTRRDTFKKIFDMTPLERVKSKIVSERKKTFLQRLGFMGRFFSGGTDELPMVRRFIFDPYKNPKVVKE